jgi:BRCT domain type II-containing protein
MACQRARPKKRRFQAVLDDACTQQRTPGKTHTHHHENQTQTPGPFKEGDVTSLVGVAVVVLSVMPHTRED